MPWRGKGFYSVKVGFANKYLLELYQKGKSKKYKLPQKLLKKYFMRIQQLETAEDIYYFWKIPKLNFEKLAGHENRFSVRLDKKWRLEFNIDFENEEKNTWNNIY